MKKGFYMNLSIGIFQSRTKRKTFRKRVGLLWLAAWVGVVSLSSGDIYPAMGNERKTGAEKVASKLGPVIKMNPLVVNLNEPGGRHYLKTTIVLELGKVEWVAEVQQQIPCITDMMIMTLGDKKLADMQNPQIKEEIRKELLAKSHRTAVGGMIRQIYFDEFLFQ
jgi:flagellar FliL protein